MRREGFTSKQVPRHSELFFTTLGIYILGKSNMEKLKAFKHCHCLWLGFLQSFSNSLPCFLSGQSDKFKNSILTASYYCYIVLIRSSESKSSVDFSMKTLKNIDLQFSNKHYVEHLCVCVCVCVCVCALWLTICLLWRNVYLVFCQLFDWLLLSCMSCLYILEIKPLSIASLANIFSYSVGFLNFFDGLLCCSKLLSLIKSC